MSEPQAEGLCVLHSETNSWTGSGEGRINEDFALIDERGACAVLVDGATGLTKANLVAGESDAAWYARSLAQAFAARLAQAPDAPLEALVAAGEEVAGRYLLLPGARDLQRIDLPNGSLAAVTWDDSRVTLVMLGDCTAVALMRDGSARSFHDGTLTALDEQNYQRMLAYARAHGTTMAAARRALNDRFIENRLKMNQPGGYWAADVTCAGLPHACLHTLDARAVSSVLVCSDGFAAAVDMGVMSDAAELARRVAGGGGRALGEALRAAEQADAGCWEHPRSKTSDDATYAYVAFA